MTQQTLTVEPPTLRYAVQANDSPSIRPGAAANEGLLRPGPGGSSHWSQEARERRAETLRKKRAQGWTNAHAPTKFRPSRYVGLMNSSGRRDKYREAERVGVTRKLLPWEIDEWYARIAAIQQGETGEAKLRGPLDEKLR